MKKARLTILLFVGFYLVSQAQSILVLDQKPFDTKSGYIMDTIYLDLDNDGYKDLIFLYNYNDYKNPHPNNAGFPAYLYLNNGNNAFIYKVKSEFLIYEGTYEISKTDSLHFQIRQYPRNYNNSNKLKFVFDRKSKSWFLSESEVVKMEQNVYIDPKTGKMVETPVVEKSLSRTIYKPADMISIDKVNYYEIFKAWY